jgi:decaprenyl-phosphate phosphoribosyltransferase
MSAKPQLLTTVPLVLFGLFRYWYVMEKLDGGDGWQTGSCCRR